jgi:hypothetical protein
VCTMGPRCLAGNCGIECYRRDSDTPQPRWRAN